MVFCHTPTWISYWYTHVPCLLDLPPISHPIPPFSLSQHPCLSSQSHTANSHWLSSPHVHRSVLCFSSETKHMTCWWTHCEVWWKEINCHHQKVLWQRNTSNRDWKSWNPEPTRDGVHTKPFYFGLGSWRVASWEWRWATSKLDVTGTVS